MKYNIIKNQDRKTITIVLSDISINYTDYLFKKYQGERFFASGVVRGAEYTKDLLPFLKEVSEALNIVGKEVLPVGNIVVPNDLITLEEDEYRLFTRNIDKEGNWDKQFRVNLTNRTKDDNKRFLFKDISGTQPITQQDGWKHIYAIELEIGVGFDEKKGKKYLFSVFHRAVSVGSKESNNFKSNDNAWVGFDFSTAKEEKKEDPSFEVKTDDLPF
jgi:hypothetical protein